MTFAERITRLNLQQKNVALAAGLHVQTVQRLVRGADNHNRASWNALHRALWHIERNALIDLLATVEARDSRQDMLMRDLVSSLRASPEEGLAA